MAKEEVDINISLSTDTLGIHLQTQKCRQNIS